jgi:diguanylate cyclase (GGDEF)-like protein/PAS domain S-box-containing protein
MRHDASRAQVHPLARQQFDEATLSPGKLDVERLLAAVSACYEASAGLAETALQVGLLGSDLDASAPSQGSALWPTDLFDTLADGLVLLDDKDCILLINQAAYALAGLSHDIPRAALLGKPLASLTLFPSHREGTSPLVDGASFTLRSSCQRDVLVEVRAWSGGKLLVLKTQFEESAETRKLHLIEQEYRSLLDNSVIGIYRCSLAGRQLRANPALVKLHGYASEEEMLLAVQDLAKGWHVDPTRHDVFMQELEASGRITDFVSQIYRQKTREILWVSQNAWLVYDQDGEPLFYEGTVMDASDRMAAEEEINHLAHHDHLTGLPNRFMLLKKLREALLRPHTASSVAVHCLDLDHFKDVNDTLGHQAGDKLLVAAGKRLRDSIKIGDVLARLGGDEFTVLQFGVRSKADMEALAQRIVATMNDPFTIGDTQVNVGVSVGVASYKGQEPAGLLRDADVALYEAKKRGRRTYAVYTAAMGNALQDRRALEDDLRAAIETGDFELLLQPIVDAKSGAVEVYEALLRWHHPTRGLVSPSRFVPLAEESSLMVALGDWVLNKTVEAAAYLPTGRRIAMNLSPIQLRSLGFVERVRAAMERFDITPDRLELEITETVIMSDDARTLNTLNALRDLGLKLALDDFGTGHASLSYLQRFRFDKIKIDQTFVLRMVDDPISAAVVRAVTSLGADMGAVVVAEGVETQEQVDALRREGCNLFQGFLFGRPVPWRQALGLDSAPGEPQG